MKKLVILALALGAWTSYGQNMSAGKALESPGAQRGKPSVRLGQTVKPTEIARGNVVYSGVAVQLVKARNPLQLFNPAAPPQYGSAEDNMSRDPTTGRASGLKFLSLRF
jgi:hypothetical protein